MELDKAIEYYGDLTNGQFVELIKDDACVILPEDQYDKMDIIKNKGGLVMDEAKERNTGIVMKSNSDKIPEGVKVVFPPMRGHKVHLNLKKNVYVKVVEASEILMIIK